ncbi:hypothetical protein PAERUG_E5_London_17_VIM_2_12_12_04056 [Pseudomonas aeruginosa]|nr:hypothetical protein PAERUG_E5_London_17_VIM_2_12_12_04056 [Pseudomonas aeruginosa]
MCIRDRVVVALADQQHVALQVLAEHVPGIVAGFLETADAEALALTDGVVHQAAVATDDLAFGGLDVARLGRQVLLEEIGEASLANEADARGVLLLRRGEAMLLGDGADFRLLQFADGEQAAGDLLAAHRVQEVALVLVRVQALEQLGAPVAVAAPHIVAGGDQVRAEHQRVVEERLELDFAVAEDVRVRRTAGLVLGKEVLEHVIPVFRGEVRRVQLDADPVADGLGVGQVLAGGTVFGAVVLVPVLHEQAFDLIALLQQEQGGDGRVDAAGHADDHALAAWGGGGFRHSDQASRANS